jgi:hypothetical protein
VQTIYLDPPWKALFLLGKRRSLNANGGQDQNCSRSN